MMNNNKKHGNFLIILIIIVVVDALFLGYHALQSHDKKNGTAANPKIVAVAEAPASPAKNIVLKSADAFSNS